jgi:hypothetical protein
MSERYRMAKHAKLDAQAATVDPNSPEGISIRMYALHRVAMLMLSAKDIADM